MFHLFDVFSENKYEEFERNLMEMGVVIGERKNLKFLGKYLRLYVRKCYQICTDNKVAAKTLDIAKAKDEAIYMINNIRTFTGLKIKWNSNVDLKKQPLPIANELIRKILDPHRKCEIFQHDRFVTRPNQILFNYVLRVDQFNLSMDWSWKTTKLQPKGLDLFLYFEDTLVFCSHDLIRLKCYATWKLIFNMINNELGKIMLTKVFLEREFEFFTVLEKSLGKCLLNGYCSWIFKRNCDSQSLKALSFLLSVCIFHSDFCPPSSINWIEMIDLYATNIEIIKLTVLHYVRNTSIGFETVANYRTGHQLIFTRYTQTQTIVNDVFELKTQWIDDRKRYCLYDLLVCNRSTKFFRLFYFDNNRIGNVRDRIETIIDNQNLRKVLLLQLCKIEYLLKLGYSLAKCLPYLVFVEIIEALTDDGIVISLLKDPLVDFELFL